MRILILEDNPDRFELFVKNLFLDDAGIDWVQTPEEAIYNLANFTYDYLFLDHDLDGKIYQPSEDGTGYEVACWLADNPDRMPLVTIVHSLHEVGAHNMLGRIPNALYYPFVWNKTWDDFIDEVIRTKKYKET